MERKPKKWSAEEYAHERNRMCAGCRHCNSSCALYAASNEKSDYNCVLFERDYPAEAVKLVQEWAEQNPEEDEA